MTTRRKTDRAESSPLPRGARSDPASRPASTPSSSPQRPRFARPQGRGFLRDNPRSSKFTFNRTYQDRRGYYYKDATGRWRTPDGKIAPAQRFDEKARTYTLRAAERFNERRHARLFKIDAINNVRQIGLPITRKGFNRVVGKTRDPEKVRDRLRAHVRERRAQRQPREPPSLRELRREFSRASARLDEVDDMIRDVGGSGRDVALDEERRNLIDRMGEIGPELAEFDEFDDLDDLDFESWGDTP